MPNGKTHDKITGLITLIITPVIFIVFGLNLSSTILIVSFLFSALMFNGDLDTNSRPYNRWWVLKMIWIPYQLMFTHRSIYTHGFIIGTFIRVLYITIIPIIFFYDNIIGIIEYNYLEIIIVLIGLELGSMSHTIADNMF